MEFIQGECGGHIAQRLFPQQAPQPASTGDTRSDPLGPARRGIHVITTSRAQLGSIVALVADASLTALSEGLHRGSLANARRAMDESRDAQAQTDAMLREYEALAPVRRLVVSG